MKQTLFVALLVTVVTINLNAQCLVDRTVTTITSEICSGQSAVIRVLSEADHLYILQLGTVQISSSMEGTGGSIEIASYPLNATGQQVISVIVENPNTGCTAMLTGQGSVLVKPVPELTILNLTPVISSEDFIDIQMASTMLNTTYNVSATAPVAIVGAVNQTGRTISFLNHNVYNNSNVSQEFTYHIVPVAGGCVGPSQNTNIRVRPRTLGRADSLFLVHFYNETGGPGWLSKTNWLTGPANTWYGLTVVNKKLTGIELPSNNLVGELTQTFGQFLDLQVVNLSGNSLSGSIRQEIGKWKNIAELYLQDNSLSGVIAPDFFMATSLAVVNLSNNDLSGNIDPSIGNLTNLYYFDISGNDVEDVPPQIFELANLRHLKLSAQFNGPVPDAIADLDALETFACNGCGITSIPAAMAMMPSLSSVELMNNDLTTIPDFTSSLVVSTLRVEGNRLTFASLEPNDPILNFTYAPQDSVGSKNVYTVEIGKPFNLTSQNVDGASSTVQWFKNGLIIADATDTTYSFANPQVEDEGNYTYKVSNSLLPQLVLHGRAQMLKVSSLKRDSLTLVALYQSTNGSAWTNKAGWLQNNLNTWFGVTLGNNRVTGLALSNNNLSGIVPSAFTDLLSATSINLSSNNLTDLPALGTMTALTQLDVSDNKLDFASLERNVSILNKLLYSNQKAIGESEIESVPAGGSVELSISTSGTNNIYSWKKDNVPYEDATQNSLVIENVNRDRMGSYTCEVTNTLVPGLTLVSQPQNVIATANISGLLQLSDTSPVTQGIVTLLRVTGVGAYDTFGIDVIDEAGTFNFQGVVLGDYQLLGKADLTAYPQSLPTYLTSVLLWEEAQLIELNGNVSGLSITIQQNLPPSTGDGTISGTLEESTPVDGRTKDTRPIVGAAVLAKRISGNPDSPSSTLAGYVYTDANGYFSITGLPVADYRLNIQYPGVPMDENSFVTFSIGQETQSEVVVEAKVQNGKINVRELIVTGLFEQEDDYIADVYPNPTESMVHVTFGMVSNSRNISVFDPRGRLVTKFAAHSLEEAFDVSWLPAGIYIVMVDDQAKIVKTVKLLIINHQ